MAPVAVIADDLTGAADTGVQFCRPGAPVLLTDHVPARRAAAGLALYTRTRGADEAAARRKLAAAGGALAALRPDLVYKKIDSCLRGNIGAETEALLTVLDMEASFIAPAFPAMGRTTVDDIHRVNGVPVAQTEIARDPVTPVTDARLSRNVRRQARLPVAHVGLPLLESSWEKLAHHVAALLAQGVRHLVFDAAERHHLDTVARLVRVPGRRILPVGSAGLAASLARRADGGKAPPPAIGRLTGPALVVCGSAAARSHRQIDVLARERGWRVITISPRRLADRRRRERLTQRAAEALAGGHLAVRVAPPGPGDRVGRRSPHELCGQLAATAAAVMRAVRPGGLLATGGDTADALFREMGVEGMRLRGEVLAGLAAGELAGGDFDGLAAVTKAGAFGGDGVLRDLFRHWCGRPPA